MVFIATLLLLQLFVKVSTLSDKEDNHKISSAFTCCEDWDYDKPDENWPICCPDCILQNNPIQSPVDIEGEISDSKLSPLVWDGYTDSNQTAVLWRTPFRFNVQFPDDYTGIFISGMPHKQFRLSEIHFHTPAENLVYGNQYPMEMHLVHFDIEDNSSIAVIGIFFRLTASPNLWLEQIVQQIPKVPHNDSSVPLSLTGFDKIFDTLVDSNKNGYFVFNGSLTSPPCSHALWFLLTEPWDFNAEQLQILTVMENIRPVQRKFSASVWRPPQYGNDDNREGTAWGIIVGIVDVVLVMGMIGYFVIKRKGFHFHKKIKQNV